MSLPSTWLYYGDYPPLLRAPPDEVFRSLPDPRGPFLVSYHLIHAGPRDNVIGP